MPTLADLQVDPQTGQLANPGQFTPGQLDDALRSGRLTYQAYQRARPFAAPAADNTADQAAAASASRGPDLRYGTNAQGQPNAPPPAAPAPAPVPPASPPGPGAAQMQGQSAPAQDPADAALGALVSPRAAPAHALGLSPADKDYLGQLKDQGAQVQNSIGQAVELNRNAVDSFKENTDTLATESQVARLSMQDEMRGNTDRRAALLRETQDRQGKIDGELSRLDAQGVDPNHYWQSRSTPQKIGAAIAIGLGAFAAHPLGPRGGGGGGNAALDIINQAIGADIDAQKTNLQKHLEVARSRMAAGAQGFDQEHALLQAERDSIQTGYSVATSDIARRAGMFKDNAEMTANAQKLTAALQQSRDERVAGVNDRIHDLRKRAETVVGGTPNPAQQVKDLSEKIYLDSKGQVSVPEARRQAANLVLGVDVKPGAATTNWNDKKPGAGLSPRLVNRLSELTSAEQSVGELNQLLKAGSSLSPSDRARATAAATNLRNQGFTSIPENPLEVLSMAGPRQAALATVLRDIKTRKQTLLTAGAGAGDDTSPEGLGGEKDE